MERKDVEKLKDCTNPNCKHPDCVCDGLKNTDIVGFTFLDKRRINKYKIQYTAEGLDQDGEYYHFTGAANEDDAREIFSMIFAPDYKILNIKLIQ